MNGEKFITWLDTVLKEKGWSYAELGRRSKMTGANVSKTMNGQQKITFDFCAAIAGPLGEEPIRLFEMAGLLPILKKPGLDAQSEKEWIYVMKNLSPKIREQVLNYAFFLQDQAEKLDSGVDNATWDDEGPQSS